MRFNLGNGSGYSVLEVIENVRRITGKQLAVHEAERRPGDPAVLVADSALARSVLDWKPVYPDLGDIVEHAWNWELNQFQ